MAVPPPDIPSDQPPLDQHATSPLISDSAAAALTYSPMRGCTLNEVNFTPTPFPSLAAILPAAPPKTSLSIPRRRHILWPASSRPLHQHISVPTDPIANPAVKRSYSTMEASSDFVAVEEDEILDLSKALVIYESKEDFWQVVFQDYKRLKSDVAEGKSVSPSDYMVQESSEVEEDSVYYDGEYLQDEEWVEYLAHNRPSALQSLMERLDVYDEEQLRLALRREQRMRWEHGPD